MARINAALPSFEVPRWTSPQHAMRSVSESLKAALLLCPLFHLFGKSIFETSAHPESEAATVGSSKTRISRLIAFDLHRWSGFHPPCRFPNRPNLCAVHPSFLHPLANGHTASSPPY